MPPEGRLKSRALCLKVEIALEKLVFRSRFAQKVLIIDVFLMVIVQNARVLRQTHQKYTKRTHKDTFRVRKNRRFVRNIRVLSCFCSHLAGFGVTGKGVRGIGKPIP